VAQQRQVYHPDSYRGPPFGPDGYRDCGCKYKYFQFTENQFLIIYLFGWLYWEIGVGIYIQRLEKWNDGKLGFPFFHVSIFPSFQHSIFPQISTD
jgi:hypothetical protein